MKDKIRKLILECYRITGKQKKLFDRMHLLEIGLTGHISLFDQSTAKDNKYKPLNKFEKWLVKPIIEIEKQRRQNVFASAVREVLGEDMGDW